MKFSSLLLLVEDLMETSNWSSNCQAVTADDWRSQLAPDSRERIINKITETLQRTCTYDGQEGLEELKNIALQLEDSIYTTATSQSLYLREISLKMLTIETNSQNAVPNSLPPNPFGNGNELPSTQVQGNESAMNVSDWRAQLQPDSRVRIVNKITETLKRHLPYSGEEGLQELKKIAARFEGKIYTAATSQSDYLRKISLKMLTMESKSQNTMPNSLPMRAFEHSNKLPNTEESEDGYTWKKYGGRRLKGSDRTFFNCTYPKCPAKKKVVRSLEGHVTELIYSCTHNHAKPQFAMTMISLSCVSSSASNDVTQAPSPITVEMDQDLESFGYGGQVSETTLQNSWDDEAPFSQSNRSESDDYDEITGRKWKGFGEKEGIPELGTITKREQGVSWSNNPFLFQ